ncbi:heterogeneous nuclear ribonucleoprotein L-like [Ochlerotatus camptorhynchus]|uniref:heterogeneous nuclear ribonucleoprotein L-like n=1 Tax=Ochlerotatus camptorhynchus TaxID=644619 RepID=UPI0031E08D90
MMMVYRLENNTANTDKLFNLYENVRIKFLKSKEGTAMVQMGDAIAVEPVEQVKAELEATNLYALPDNSISFKDYSASKNNRVLSLTQASKNRFVPPSKILLCFNIPPESAADCIRHQGLSPVATLVVNAIMCNHSAIDHKGTRFPFIMKLCFSSSKTINGAWSNENIENMGMGMAPAPGNTMSAAAATTATPSGGVTPISVPGGCLKSEHDEPM